MALVSQCIHFFRPWRELLSRPSYQALLLASAPRGAYGVALHALCDFRTFARVSREIERQYAGTAVAINLLPFFLPLGNIDPYAHLGGALVGGLLDSSF